MRISIVFFDVLALLVAATLDPCFGAIIAAIVVILMFATVIEWSNRHDG